MTQTQSILEHLEDGHALTPMEALERFGCFRLAARVEELRKRGHRIVTDKLRTAAGKTIAEYRIGGE